MPSYKKKKKKKTKKKRKKKDDLMGGMFYPVMGAVVATATAKTLLDYSKK